MPKPHLKRTRRQLMSPSKWKLRIIFWSAAIVIGATAALFAIASNFSDGLYHRLYDYSPPLAYVVTPLGLALIAWLTKCFFQGTEGSGILFAIEEMSRKFEERTSGVLIIAVVLAGVTAVAFLGNYTYFGSSSTQLPFTPLAWLVVIIAALVGGLLGGLFSRTLICGTRRLAPLLGRYPIMIAFSCGLILSLLGFFSGGHTYGTGYEEARQLVMGSGEIDPGFPLLKMLATVASYLSGIPGGIFAPSLAIGAGLGADLAMLFQSLPMQALVMLGMVSYFTGVVQTPITAFVIVMEMTDNSSMLLPLMAAALIAKGVSHLVCPRPIYQALADAYLAKTSVDKH